MECVGQTRARTQTEGGCTARVEEHQRQPRLRRQQPGEAATCPARGEVRVQPSGAPPRVFPVEDSPRCRSLVPVVSEESGDTGETPDAGEDLSRWSHDAAQSETSATDDARLKVFAQRTRRVLFRVTFLPRPLPPVAIAGHVSPHRCTSLPSSSLEKLPTITVA